MLNLLCVFDMKQVEDCNTRSVSGLPGDGSAVSQANACLEPGLSQGQVLQGLQQQLSSGSHTFASNHDPKTETMCENVVAHILGAVTDVRMWWVQETALDNVIRFTPDMHTLWSSLPFHPGQALFVHCNEHNFGPLLPNPLNLSVKHPSEDLEWLPC